MKYYAEFLSNLNNVYIAIEAEDDANKLDIQAVSKTQLRLPNGVVNLPVAVQHTHSSYSLHGSTQLKLKAAPPITLVATPKTVPSTCKCGSPLAPTTTKWRRLPSEHWAELMDLWHCHKPAEPQPNEDGMYKLAMNGFHPQPGTAFYSDTYVLIHEEDVVAGMHADTCTIAHNKPQFATRTQDGTLKIWKWDLSKDGNVSSVLSLMLAELIDAHAVFTFIVNSELIIWVVNPDTQFTYTGSERPFRGVKIYYGNAADLKSKRPDAETIDLPAPVFSKLKTELTNTSNAIPEKVRNFGDWTLAVLTT